MNNKENIFAGMNEEQLPVAENKLHGGKHFAGLYAGEHVAATEFVIGATFVTMGASTMNILIGLLIGNILAVLSWTFITAPIAVQTRLSLYTYLEKIAGPSITKFYNWANAIIFTVISAAMITVSALAVRVLFDIPTQQNWYSTNIGFLLIVIIVGLVVVLVALYGFSSVANFSSICAPWLFTMFMAGALVLFPLLANSVFGATEISSWSSFIHLGDVSIWKGVTADGKPGISLIGIIGYAWAANSITHLGLIDMAILRYAKKSYYGLYTSFGMLFGHYLAWIAAGIMGAGAAILLQKSMVELDPGDVAYQALGASGFIIIVIAGWTTANANLYRAGLAAQAIFKDSSRRRTTLIVGLVTVVIACFPFVYKQILPLLAYSGLIVVPIGAIVATEHFLFPKIGLTRYWAKYRKLNISKPAIITWATALIFGFGMNISGIMSTYYVFIPTYIFSVILYIILAYYGGAKGDFSKEEREENEFLKTVKKYQTAKAKHEIIPIKDTSFLSRILNIFSIICLLAIITFAFICLLESPDMTIYYTNKDNFNIYTLILTLGYFVTAYWALHRKQALARNTFEQNKL